jgi:uncharacterized membrane protein
MREWLILVSEPVIVAIDAIALLVIVVGTAEVLVMIVRAALRPLPDAVARRAWLRYARWLVAALTFELAADIVETSISTGWQNIARVGALAVIRTFLNYFLERDVVHEEGQIRAAPQGTEVNPPASSGRL